MRQLRAVELVLAYDQSPVVCDLSLTVPDGRIACIVGPNACGKSTLLRALARLMRPEHGVLLLDGAALHGCAPRTSPGCAQCKAPIMILM